jgi:hypothetical protein
VAGFLDSQSNANQTEAIYDAYFGRAGDGPGYVYWTSQFAADEGAGLSPAQAAVSISQSFAVQPEATAKYAFLASPPAVLSTTDPVQIAAVDTFINQVYQNLFNRAADTDGLAYWQGQILSGMVSVGAAVYDIGDGAQGSDQTVLADKITAASTFTTSTYAANLGTTSPLDPSFYTAAQASVASVVDATSLAASQAATAAFVQTAAQPSLTLTPGEDTVATSAAGAVFNAPLVNTSTQVASVSFNVQTLTSFDSLTDSSSDGTLKAILAPGLGGVLGGLGVVDNVTNVTMSGISTAFLTNSNSATSATLVPFGSFAGPTAIVSGSIAGLTTVDDQSSSGGIQLGNTGVGLQTALTNVNVTGYSGANGSDIFTGVLAKSVGAAANTIAVAISGPVGATTQGAFGGPATASLADKLVFENDGATGTKAAPNLSYGTWALTADNTANLELIQGGVGGATALTLAGAGNYALGQDVSGNWQNLTTIDASKATGNVIITGASAGVFSAAASTGNYAGLYGSDAGLLTGNTALTTFDLGTGVNTLDVSSFTTNAQLAALTTTQGSNMTTTNEIIVSGVNADTLSSTTFANIHGFQILGVTGVGGTINFADLPSSIDQITYQTNATGGVILNNVPTIFTVDTEANGFGNSLTIGAVGAASGLSDSVNVIIGSSQGSSALAGPSGSLGTVTMTGEESVTFTAQGGTTAADMVGHVFLTPSLTGNEHVNIAVTAATADFGDSSGALADLTSTGALNTNNFTMTITGTGVTTFETATSAGSPLHLMPIGDSSGPFNFSTNAVTIDASASGGLIMHGGDANYTTSMTVAGSTGDTITGSAAHSNVLQGSIGNDTLTGNTTSNQTDTIITSGGADKITLSSGHLGSVVDHVGLFTAGAPGSIVDATDSAQLGWWGNATGGVHTAVPVSVAGTGITSDMSVVSGFTGGTGAAPTPGDSVGLQPDAWSGLLHSVGDMSSISAGTAAVLSSPIVAGGTVSDGNILELGSPFADAKAVANGLAGATTGITFATATTSAVEHFIVAYQDLSGSVRLADLDIHAAVGTTHTAGADLAVSDMIQLTGVSLANLHNTNIHFV